MSSHRLKLTILIVLAFLVTLTSIAIHPERAYVKGTAHSNKFADTANHPVSIAPLFTELKKLRASEDASRGLFGYSVGISGDTVVVGAVSGDSSKGSGYIFKRNKGGLDNWGEVKRLSASDGTAGDQFGISVAISGDTVVVAAYGDDFGRGSAFVFGRNKGGADNWGEVKKLTASGGQALDGFGSAVGIDGDRIVVGAANDDLRRGSAFVFERNKGGADNWGEVTKLAAIDGILNDRFGFSVAINRDTIVVAAFVDDNDRGSVYIYDRNKGGADTWGQVKKLTASDGSGGDLFGYSVGISGDTVIIGAANDDSGKGSAYVFEQNKGGADNWGEVKKVTAADGVGNDTFGLSVGISLDTVVVGADNDDSGRGSAHVFQRNKGGTENWGEVEKLNASDGVANDRFGGAVGISGTMVVVGASSDDSFMGSAYTFTAPPEAVNVSAANFQRGALAPEMITAAFGVDLATGTEPASTVPLPTNLRGTTVGVRDSAGTERLARLFFVSPGQVNYYMPPGTSAGPATVKITSGSGAISLGTVEIAPISPGIFSANSTGLGIAAAIALRVRGTQQIREQISRFDAGTNSFVPIPVDLGPAGDQVFLIMFGTGFRFRSSDNGVNVKVGGRQLQSLFSGMVAGLLGLDQMNISPLPRELAGAGLINIEITVDGKVANTTTVSIK